MRRRPYHAGSILGAAPKQDLSSEDQVDWISRVRAYWPRSNAKAGDVARALLRFIGADGACFPCLQTLAAAARCSVKTVQHWIVEFSAKAFIQKITRRNLFGQTSNAYVFLDPEVVAPAGQPARDEPFSSDSAKPCIYSQAAPSTQPAGWFNRDRGTAQQALERVRARRTAALQVAWAARYRKPG
jgi:hypothetical protein